MLLAGVLMQVNFRANPLEYWICYGWPNVAWGYYEDGDDSTFLNVINLSLDVLAALGLLISMGILLEWRYQRKHPHAITVFVGLVVAIFIFLLNHSPAFSLFTNHSSVDYFGWPTPVWCTWSKWYPNVGAELSD